MDYSRYQVKYIENPTFVRTIPNIEEDIETPDYNNISYLNAEAAPATALI